MINSTYAFVMHVSSLSLFLLCGNMWIGIPLCASFAYVSATLTWLNLAWLSLYHGCVTSDRFGPGAELKLCCLCKIKHVILRVIHYSCIGYSSILHIGNRLDWTSFDYVNTFIPCLTTYLSIYSLFSRMFTKPTFAPSNHHANATYRLRRQFCESPRVRNWYSLTWY